MSVILQVRVNAGAWQSGDPITGTEIYAVDTDQIDLTAVSKVGWGSSPPARWEIYDYPPGFPLPAGWSEEAASGIYYYSGNEDPPAIIVDANWGKFVFNLHATEGTVRTVDYNTGVIVLSPGGLKGIGRGEGARFGGAHLRWVKNLMEDAGVLDTLAALSAVYTYAPTTASIKAATATFIRGVTTGGLIVTPGADGSASTATAVNANGTTVKPFDLAATVLRLIGNTSTFIRGITTGTPQGGLLITPGADGAVVTLAAKNADATTTKPLNIVASALTLNGSAIGGALSINPFTSGTPTLVAAAGPGALNRLSGTVSAATLPAAVSGETAIVEIIGLGPIVVTRAGADTINGSTTYIVPGATDPERTSVRFVCDAAGAWTVGTPSLFIRGPALGGALVTPGADAATCTIAAKNADGTTAKPLTTTGSAAEHATTAGNLRVICVGGYLQSQAPSAYHDITTISHRTSPGAEALCMTETLNATGACTYNYVAAASCEFQHNASPRVAFDATTVSLSATGHIKENAAGTIFEREYLASATISSATTTTVDSFVTASERVYAVELHGYMSNDTDNEGAVFHRVAAFKNVAGTVTQIGTSKTPGEAGGDGFYFQDAGQAAVNLTLDFSGTSIRARLTTDVADTVNINTQMKIRERVLA